MNTYARLFISFCFVALTAATPAATIWDNGGPDFTDALASDPGTMPLPSQAGDDFTVGTTATANQIQWWGAYSPSDTPTQPDNFTIRFFNIVAGVPAIVPFASYSIGEVVGVDTGSNLTAIDLDVYSFTAAFPPRFWRLVPTCSRSSMTRRPIPMTIGSGPSQISRLEIPSFVLTMVKPG